jgi:hypothetical protein
MTNGSAANDQAMARALDDVAEAADETALDQQRLARRARSMSRQRRSGSSWIQILHRERQPGLLVLMTRSARRLHEVSGRFRPVLGQALVDEGLSTRQVARMFGVTRQRISAMLSRAGSAATPLVTTPPPPALP